MPEDKSNNEEEKYQLQNINANEISIVDNPAIDEGWIILKRKVNNDEEEVVSKSVITYKDLGKADEDETWDGNEEVKNAEVNDLKLMCAWYDSDNVDVKSSYKLPHHKASGKHVAVWNGVSAAMGALMGARSKLSVPDKDKKSIYNHLKQHYEKDFDKEVPEFVLKANNDDYCYCSECKIKILHEKGIPCKEVKCPECDNLMSGVPDENIEYKELKQQMAEEKKEEVTKMEIKEAAAKAATMLEEATGGSDEDKKRIKLLIGNLKSLGGAKKATDEEDKEDEEMEKEVEKAGRKFSKETTATLSEVSMGLKKAAKSLDAILKGEGKVTSNKEEEDMKKSTEDFGKQMNDIMKFYKDGLLTDSEVGKLLEQIGSK